MLANAREDHSSPLVEGEGWMVLAIDIYDYGIFWVTYSEASIKTVYCYDEVWRIPRSQGSLLPVPTGTEREPGNEVGFEGYGSSQVLVI